MEEMSPLAIVRRNEAAAKQRRLDEAAHKETAKVQRKQLDIERRGDVPALVHEILETIADYVAFMQIEDHPDYEHARTLRRPHPRTFMQRLLPGLVPARYDVVVAWSLGYASGIEDDIVFMNVTIDGSPYMTTARGTLPGFVREVEMTRERLESMPYSDLEAIRKTITLTYEVRRTLSRAHTPSPKGTL